MAKSDAERSAAYHKRRKKKLAECQELKAETEELAKLLGLPHETHAERLAALAAACALAKDALRENTPEG